MPFIVAKNFSARTRMYIKIDEHGEPGFVLRRDALAAQINRYTADEAEVEGAK